MVEDRKNGSAGGGKIRSPISVGLDRRERGRGKREERENGEREVWSEEAEEFRRKTEVGKEG